LLVVMVNLRGGERNQRSTFSYFQFPLKGPRFLWGILRAILFIYGFFLINSVNAAMDRTHFENGSSEFRKMLAIQNKDTRMAIEHGEKALAEFRSAIKLNPLNSFYHYQMGRAGYDLESTKALVKEGNGKTPPDLDLSFRIALRLNPTDAALHYDVGMYYLLNWNSMSPKEQKVGVAAFRNAVSREPRLKSETKKFSQAAKDIFAPKALEIINEVITSK